MAVVPAVTLMDGKDVNPGADTQCFKKCYHTDGQMAILGIPCHDDDD